MVVGAFAIVYVVWGSTYLAIRFGVETLPPFTMAGVRFLTAGLLLYAFLAVRVRPRPTRGNWFAAAIVGTLMLFGGNGLVCWSEQFVHSGLAALFIATVPLWMVTLDWLIYRGPRLTGRVILGLIGGLVGIYILIGPSNIAGEPIDTAGGLVLLAACVFWSVGSLYARKANLPRSTALATSMEMITGGGVMVLIGLATGEWARIDPAVVSGKSLLALGYLIVFGSIIALSTYRWLLSVSTPARVSTYAFVNPVIAVLLGALLADEPLTPRVGVAAGVILVSVMIITLRSPRRQLATASVPQDKITPEASPVCIAEPCQAGSIRSSINGE